MFSTDKEDSMSDESDSISVKSVLKQGGQLTGAARVANVFRWSSSFEYLVMSIGAHTALLNFRQFKGQNPDKYGNLIQVAIVYIFLGIPVSYMQVVLGQYTHVGLFFLSRMIPLGTGISYVCFLTVFATSIVHMLVMETFVLYLIICFESSGLQWMSCIPTFKDTCWEVGMGTKCGNSCISEGIYLSTYIYWNQTFMDGVYPIQKSTIGYPEGSRIWGSCMCWFLIFLVSIVEFGKFKKVIKWLVSIAIIFKFVLVISLLAQVNDPLESLRATFWFSFKSFKTFQAWKNSIQIVVQSLTLGDFTFMMFGVFNSTTVKAGSLMCFNGILSYFLRLIDILLISSATFYIANIAGLPHDKQYLLFRPRSAEMGVGIIPAALGNMGAARIWSVLYFLIRCGTVLLRVNITFLLMQKALYQRFPILIPYSRYIVPILCSVGFGLGAILESKEAYEIFKDTMFLIATFVDHINVLILTILVFYIYGINRFSDDIHFMHGIAPTKFWKGTWVISPILLAMSVNMEYLNQEHPFFVKRTIIICLMFSPYIIMLTIEIFKKIYKRDIVSLFRPDPSWGPIDPEKREQRATFNPKHDTRYTKKVYKCQHKCLLGNKALAKIIQDEDSVAHPFDVHHM